MMLRKLVPRGSTRELKNSTCFSSIIVINHVQQGRPDQNSVLVNLNCVGASPNSLVAVPANVSSAMSPFKLRVCVPVMFPEASCANTPLAATAPKKGILPKSRFPESYKSDGAWAQFLSSWHIGM